MSTSDPALPAPQRPNLTITPVQVLALLAVVTCVAATAWAGISAVDLDRVRLPLAAASLLCAFMSTVAVTDWRGKAGFVAFMVFTGYVVFKDDPTKRPAAPILDAPAAQSARGEPARRPGGRFRSAAAYLHLRSFPEREAEPVSAGAAFTNVRGRALVADTVSLRLDSIRAIHDGSSGTSDWRFDVYVNRYLRLPLGRGTYHDAPGSRTQKIARTARFVPAGSQQNALVVQVQGIRAALFGNYSASGQSQPVRLSELDYGPRPVTVDVEAPQTEHGQFTFFFTIRRA